MTIQGRYNVNKRDKDGNFVGMKVGIAIVAKQWFYGEFWTAIWVNDGIYKMYKDAIALHSEIVSLIDMGYTIEWY